jgi:hypothetical protein
MSLGREVDGLGRVLGDLAEQQALELRPAVVFEVVTHLDAVERVTQCHADACGRGGRLLVHLDQGHLLGVGDVGERSAHRRAGRGGDPEVDR